MIGAVEGVKLALRGAWAGSTGVDWVPTDGALSEGSEGENCGRCTDMSFTQGVVDICCGSGKLQLDNAFCMSLGSDAVEEVDICMESGEVGTWTGDLGLANWKGDFRFGLAGLNGLRLAGLTGDLLPGDLLNWLVGETGQIICATLGV